MKTIDIRCKSAIDLELDELCVLQKDLKSLSRVDYERYRKQITETGYAFPIKAWRDEEGKWQIVGGTQCFRTLKQMRDVEKYIIPRLPVTVVEADNLRQACHRVMQDASSYGKMEDQGLYEFMQMASMTAAELKANFRTPEIRQDKFEEEFFGLIKEGEELIAEVVPSVMDEELEPVETTTSDSVKETPKEEPKQEPVCCPQCGYEISAQ